MARYCTRENEPLKKWNGIPIYLTTILAASLVAGLLFAAVLQSLRSPLLEQLIFSVPGEDWGIVSALTYPFIDRISFFTPFAIFFFYRFGVGIETHLGRGVLTKLLLLLVLVPVAIALALWHVLSVPGQLYGDYFIFMGLVIAFSTLYPTAEFVGWIPFKWVAFACLLCGSMMELAERDWISLTSLWGCAAAGFLYMRHAMEGDHDDYVPVAARVRSWFRKRPRLRVVPKAAPTPRPTTPVPAMADEADLEIDPLLDKIAKSGLASLSNAERAKLERARQELLKKEHP